MAFAIVRTEKLKTAGNIGGLNNHLTRTMDVPNADPELAPWNSRPIGSENLLSDVQNRFDELGIKPRKNAVWAIEHLMTASPEAFDYKKIIDQEGKVALRGNVQKWKAFENDCREWLKERYGKENVVNFTVHKDESTPHIHAVVVPIDKKGKLNCREYLGGREKMRDLQTSFAQKVEHLGLERGIEGSKAKHQDIKRFYEVIKQEPQFLSISKIDVKAPEKGMFGLGYKQDPGELAKEETERVNKLLQEASLKANKSLLDASAYNSKAKIDQNKYRGLEATIKRYKALNDQLSQHKEQLEKKIAEERKVYWDTIQKVAKGEFTPQKAQSILEEQQREEKKLKAYQSLGFKKGGISR